MNNIRPEFGELLAMCLKTIHKFPPTDRTDKSGWNLFLDIFKINIVMSR